MLWFMVDNVSSSSFCYQKEKQNVHSLKLYQRFTGTQLATRERRAFPVYLREERLVTLYFKSSLFIWPNGLQQRTPPVLRATFN